ncbi:uncharacterized protein LOC122300243 [Carya illinoinensis]|uniref:uncharacterized protein LOC122300243 n=1 Tax=Carya illinoinensis TaxID=32201 RepID=UPI001C728879|nr:uncharacterized protein LOC122300243 [Carya illinoinensis]XP_042966681.1 uncharacterized protein LOC122300243 [Carya illinoinensis]XP_042966682.1 uncharacterized protein LOC122300243 [Carya illinoinensis]XP_042966683.1 uncharacterized protein LOC122300243 [Carya illinoinensis]XP_042966684.1 uncharacterized protein LOC122300243 [Carya illinoinensis]XP_042966685.1 uncharacterized protein LOC122300243 [Carya illinoinensis]XP_042966686.1 uncharacterized protein LOC122300243 [Carya illinoinensi
MVRQKDPFWRHAKNLENGRRFSCNYCGDKFSGGISRFKWHLSGLKCHDIKVCDQVPRDVRLAVRQVLDTSKKKDIQVEYENCSVSLSSSGSRDLPNSDNDNDKYQLLDKQLAKWFFLFAINPEAIASPIFSDIVTSIGEYGSCYRPPFVGFPDLMEDVEEDAVKYVTNFRRDQVQSSCALIVDCGMIFGYSQTGTACLETFDEEGELDYIFEVLSLTINCLGPNRVLQLFISSPYSCPDIRRECEVKYPGIIQSCCAAELFCNFLRSLKWDLHSTLGFVSLICFTCWYYKPSSREGLKIPTKSGALILFILKSVLSMEVELQDVSFSSIIGSSEEVMLLEDEQERASCFIRAKLLDYVIRQKEFWSRVKSVAHVWVILFQTSLVVRKDSNIGYVYQMMERLKDGIEKSREQDYFMFDRSWKMFGEMRKKMIHPIHAAAAFLDPAYMYMDNFEMNAEMKAGLDYMFENMIDSDEKEAFTMELQKYRMKLPELFTAQAITKLKTRHPRIWWDLCGKHTVPVLSKYAIRIVSQPCSNLFRGLYSGTMSHELEMGESRVNRINTMIMNENSRSVKFEPIILDKLGEDLDPFLDTEYWLERYNSEVLKRLIDDAVVDCVINDSSPFWDKVKNKCDLLGIGILGFNIYL